MTRRGTKINGPFGQLYAIRYGFFVKLGFSTCVRYRKQALDQANPVPGDLIWLYQDGGGAAESLLHDHMAKYHHRLEWFNWSDEFMDDLSKFSHISILAGWEMERQSDALDFLRDQYKDAIGWPQVRAKARYQLRKQETRLSRMFSHGGEP